MQETAYNTRVKVPSTITITESTNKSYIDFILPLEDGIPGHQFNYGERIAGTINKIKVPYYILLEKLIECVPFFGEWCCSFNINKPSKEVISKIKYLMYKSRIVFNRTFHEKGEIYNDNCCDDDIYTTIINKITLEEAAFKSLKNWINYLYN